MAGCLSSSRVSRAEKGGRCSLRRCRLIVCLWRRSIWRPPGFARKPTGSSRLVPSVRTRPRRLSLHLSGRACRSPSRAPAFTGLMTRWWPVPTSSRWCCRGFAAQIGGHLILGYNIGFDLAVLEAEAERHGVDWSWSAALCLRQLATCLLGTETMMMLGDLEALATHCQVPVVDRHTALGDAAIALAIYRHLLPALAEAGIVTLGDAWREVARLDSLRQANVAAGWVDVAAAHAAAGSCAAGADRPLSLSAQDPRADARGAADHAGRCHSCRGGGGDE